jgi:hypothetical protein
MLIALAVREIRSETEREHFSYECSMRVASSKTSFTANGVLSAAEVHSSFHWLKDSELLSSQFRSIAIHCRSEM